MEFKYLLLNIFTIDSQNCEIKYWMGRYFDILFI